MGIYSVWPYVVSMAGLLLLADTPLFRWADTPPTNVRARVMTLDGLRGFLALAVFYSHTATYGYYLRTGFWAFPPSDYYVLLGQVAVAMFFMITGYLFWGKLIRSRGKPDWLTLYVDRIFRIGPLYLAATLVVFAIVAWRTNFTLVVPVIELIKQIIKWALLGLYSAVDVNGEPQTGVILAGVTWSLQFEWWFYASLILLAPIASSRSTQRLFPYLGLVVCLAIILARPISAHPSSYYVGWTTFFFAGASAAAYLRDARPIQFKNLKSAIAALLIVATLGLFVRLETIWPMIFLVAAFFLIASGADMFGLLTARASRRLGDISYGIYLLQGLVFTLLLALPGAKSVALDSPVAHWSFMFVCAVVLITVATAAHALIERPGIKAGKRLRWSLMPRWKGGTSSERG